MNKTAVVSARIHPDIKEKSEKILKTLGLSTTEAITIFFNQIALKKGLPFPVEIPNEATRQAIKEVLSGKNLPTTKSMDEFKKAMTN